MLAPARVLDYYLIPVHEKGTPGRVPDSVPDVTASENEVGQAFACPLRPRRWNKHPLGLGSPSRLVPAVNS